MNTSPLGILAAILIVGVTIEVVERESKKAAYALVALLLLGIVTFNARAFTQQTNKIFGVLNTRITGSRASRSRQGGNVPSVPVTGSRASRSKQ